jgi:hypothetical protein
MRLPKDLRKAIACVLVLVPFLAAEDLYLTLEDGVSVILHTNYTWDYEKGGAISSHLGEPITLDDGSTLVLNKNGTWGFVVEEDTGGRKTTNLQSVNAVGVSQREELDEARAGAMEEALKRLAKQLRAGIPELSGTKEQTLLDCVENEEKSVESSEERLKLWKATVKLGLDAAGIQNILHCVETIDNLDEEE